LKANILGYDWETSWIKEDINNPKSKQILRDLQKKLNPDLKKGEIIAIDREDHSCAVELFEVLAVFKKSGIVKLAYSGGAS